MRRVMIQADDELLERARAAARRRGVSFPQLVREALEGELGSSDAPAPRSVGVVQHGRLRERSYEPDRWRS